VLVGGGTLVVSTRRRVELRQRGLVIWHGWWDEIPALCKATTEDGLVIRLKTVLLSGSVTLPPGAFQ
jgi:hypothetical protein